MQPAYPTSDCASPTGIAGDSTPSTAALYFLATRLLSPSQRPAVHALYGFARYADDILDDLNSDAGVLEREARLEQLAGDLLEGFLNEDEASEAVLPAVLHTARRYGIGPSLFDEFLASMRMDLTVTDYPDRPALNRYMRGSAEVIGLQMLPILGSVCSAADAEPYAEALGRAFQLTNFLRDVNEDLQRNRVYLPADELAAFGVDRDVLTFCQRNGRTDPRVKMALAAQHDHPRRVPRGPQGHRVAGAGVAAVSRSRSLCTRRSWTGSRTWTSRCSASGQPLAMAVACKCSSADWCVPAGPAGRFEAALMDKWQYLLLLGDAC